MSGYAAGDVVLAYISLGGGDQGKVRPAVISGKNKDGSYNAYPVTGSEPAGQPYLPVELADFDTGGLDLFDESYILVSMPVMIKTGAIRGKKGRLNRVFLEKLLPL